MNGGMIMRTLRSTAAVILVATAGLLAASCGQPSTGPVTRGLGSLAISVTCSGCFDPGPPVHPIAVAAPRVTATDGSTSLTFGHWGDTVFTGIPTGTYHVSGGTAWGAGHACGPRAPVDVVIAQGALDGVAALVYDCH
jgi:hypothetical protein